MGDPRIVPNILPSREPKKLKAEQKVSLTAGIERKEIVKRDL